MGNIRLSTFLNTILLLFIAFLVLYPLLMLVYGSFKAGPPGEPSPFTLRGYSTVYTQSSVYKVLGTTLWLGMARAVLALAIAVFLAWVVTRTDVPFRGILEVFVWVQFFVPAQPYAMAWIALAAPDYGLINKALVSLFGPGAGILDVFSYGGIIWVSSISWAAILFVLITPAFRGMDASLEESSRMCGANSLTTLRRVTLPVLTPALVGAFMLALVKLMETFETELLLGFPKGIFVYATQVWWLTTLNPPEYTQALALSTVFILIVFAIVFLQWRIIGARQYVTVTGRGFATRPMRLGLWRYGILALFLSYVIFGTLLPLGALWHGSFMKLFGIPVEEPYTVEHWQRAFQDPRLLSTLWNTAFVGLVAASVGMVLYSLISYIVVRTKFRGGKSLDFLSWLPWGVPAMVLALGFLWAYVGGLRLPFMLYGTVWLLMLVFVVRGLPLGVRTMNGAMVQLGKELEESSRILGASWTYTFRRILAPLLAPSFIASWIILFVLATKDLATVVLLYGPNSRVLSVLLLEHYLAGEMSRAVVVAVVQTFFILAFALVGRFIAKKQEVPV